MSPFVSQPSSEVPGDSEQSKTQKLPSLMDRLRTSNLDIGHPPHPKPFAMGEPFKQPTGLWCFWLAADEPLLEFVSHLGCVINLSTPSPFSRAARGRVLFGINPRYDYAEAWMWIYKVVESEVEPIELSNQWLQALDEAGETDLDL